MRTELSVNKEAKEIIEGFYQYGAGNCASIAIIKASIMAFQRKPILLLVNKSDDSVEFRMRDAQKIYRISKKEIDLAKRMAGFRGEDIELLDYAHFLFAAMAKRVQIEGNDNQDDLNYSEAIETLNDGELYTEGPYWLGLEKFVIYGPDRKLPWYEKAKEFLMEQTSGIGKSPKHTWFSSKGLNDEYGTISAVRGTTSGAIALDIKAISSL